MKLVYDESYGTISFAQRAAYRKYNVSPADHHELVVKYGADNHKDITIWVKEHSPKGYYNPWVPIDLSQP